MLSLVAAVVFALACVMIGVVATMARIERQLSAHTSSHNHDLNDKAVEKLTSYIDEEHRITYGPLNDRLAFVEKAIAGLREEDLPDMAPRMSIDEWHERTQRNTLPPGPFVVIIDD